MQAGADEKHGRTVMVAAARDATEATAHQDRTGF